MALFNDPAEVYGAFGRVIFDLVTDEAQMGRFQRTGSTVQWVLRRPDATITVQTVPDAAPQIDLGPTRLRPDVVLSMDAQTAHEFFLGELNPTVALSRGQIKTRGSVAKVLELIPLLRPAFDRYRAMVEAAGEEFPAAVALRPEPRPAPAEQEKPAAEEQAPAAEEQAPAAEEPPAPAAEEQAPAAEEPPAAPAEEPPAADEERPAASREGEAS